MDVEIKLDSTVYTYVGGEWYETKTLIKPPRVIIERLNQYLPAQLSAETTRRTTPRL